MTGIFVASVLLLLAGCTQVASPEYGPTVQPDGSIRLGPGWMIPFDLDVADNGDIIIAGVGRSNRQTEPRSVLIRLDDDGRLTSFWVDDSLQHVDNVVSGEGSAVYLQGLGRERLAWGTKAVVAKLVDGEIVWADTIPDAWTETSLGELSDGGCVFFGIAESASESLLVNSVTAYGEDGGVIWTASDTTGRKTQERFFVTHPDGSLQLISRHGERTAEAVEPFLEIKAYDVRSGSITRSFVSSEHLDDVIPPMAVASGKEESIFIAAEVSAEDALLEFSLAVAHIDADAQLVNERVLYPVDAPFELATAAGTPDGGLLIITAEDLGDGLFTVSMEKITPDLTISWKTDCGSTFDPRKVLVGAGPDGRIAILLPVVETDPGQSSSRSIFWRLLRLDADGNSEPFQ